MLILKNQLKYLGCEIIKTNTKTMHLHVISNFFSMLKNILVDDPVEVLTEDTLVDEFVDVDGDGDGDGEDADEDEGDEGEPSAKVLKCENPHCKQFDKVFQYPSQKSKHDKYGVCY